MRIEEERLCCLVIVSVRPDGTKELVAIADGYRESTESWADLPRDLKRRGLRAPVLAVGDGALGSWGALREVFPATRDQRCWVLVVTLYSERCSNRSEGLLIWPLDVCHEPGISKRSPPHHDAIEVT